MRQPQYSTPVCNAATSGMIVDMSMCVNIKGIIEVAFWRAMTSSKFNKSTTGLIPTVHSSFMFLNISL